MKIFRYLLLLLVSVNYVSARTARTYFSFTKQATVNSCELKQHGELRDRVKIKNNPFNFSLKDMSESFYFLKIRENRQTLQKKL